LFVAQMVDYFVLALGVLRVFYYLTED
jgi:hypothetical protein